MTDKDFIEAMSLEEEIEKLQTENKALKESKEELLAFCQEFKQQYAAAHGRESKELNKLIQKVLKEKEA